MNKCRGRTREIHCWAQGQNTATLLLGGYNKFFCSCPHVQQCLSLHLQTWNNTLTRWQRLGWSKLGNIHQMKISSPQWSPKAHNVHGNCMGTLPLSADRSAELISTHQNLSLKLNRDGCNKVTSIGSSQDHNELHCWEMEVILNHQ